MPPGFRPAPDIGARNAGRKAGGKPEGLTPHEGAGCSTFVPRTFVPRTRTGAES